LVIVTSETVLFDYWRSSASYRVRIALNLAGVAYRSIPVDLPGDEQAGDDHLARNPQGLVPVLDIDGLRLTQSLAIAEYLNETRPQAGLLPDDAAGRARVRMLAHAIAMEIHPVCNLRVVNRVEHLCGGGDDVRRDWMRHFIALGLNAFERLLQSGPAGRFCHGDQPSLADICLVPQFYNAARWGVDTSRLTRTNAVAAACAQLDPFAKAAPDNVR
jgi:maleylacetoacetate isomerase